MYKLKHLLVALVASAGLFTVLSSSAHATSFTVAAGNDENTDNASCSLTEAIENINDQATTNTDCSPTGAYGTDDTIYLPAGTITLTAHLPTLAVPISITGQGMDATTIDGDGIYVPFATSSGANLSISLMRITNYINAAISVLDSDLIASNLDIDGTGTSPAAPSLPVSGIFFKTEDGSSYDLVATDVYIHDFSNSEDDSAVLGIIVVAGGGSTVNFDISKSTIANLDVTGTSSQVYGIGLSTGIFSTAGFDSGYLEGSIDNVTVNNISNADALTAAGIGVLSGVMNGTASVDLDVNNVTIREVQAPEHLQFAGGHGTALFAAGAAASPDDSVVIGINATNTLVSNSIGVPAEACAQYDFSGLLMGTGTPEITFTSSGGNVSDDTSCSSYFTQPTDQNNVMGLASTLGTLGDYGGYVPTIPLLEGSPAIDAGVTVAGLTSDARGVSRPLGLAYDSGAYESPFTKPTSTETLASTGESARVLLVAVGVFIAGSVFVTWRRRVLQ